MDERTGTTKAPAKFEGRNNVIQIGEHRKKVATFAPMKMTTRSEIAPVMTNTVMRETIGKAPEAEAPVLIVSRMIARTVH
jgi:hypothetical protein